MPMRHLTCLKYFSMQIFNKMKIASDYVGNLTNGVWKTANIAFVGKKN